MLAAAAAILLSFILGTFNGTIGAVVAVNLREMVVVSDGTLFTTLVPIVYLVDAFFESVVVDARVVVIDNGILGASFGKAAVWSIVGGCFGIAGIL